MFLLLLCSKINGLGCGLKKSLKVLRISNATRPPTAAAINTAGKLKTSIYILVLDKAKPSGWFSSLFSLCGGTLVDLKPVNVGLIGSHFSQLTFLTTLIPKGNS